MNIEFNNNTCNRLNDFLLRKELTQIIGEATRPSSGSIIDHIYTNNDSTFTYDCIHADVSDHVYITMKLNWRPNLKFSKKLQFYNYSERNLDKVRKGLLGINWYTMLDSKDVNEAANILNRNLSNLVVKHCKAEKTLSEGRIAFPKSLRNLRSKVKTKYNAWKKTPGDREKENSYRNLLKRYQKTYKAYLKHKLETSLMEKNPRKLWENIKTATNTGKDKDKEQIKLENTNHASVPDAFNNYFSSIADRIHDELDKLDGDPNSYLQQTDHTPKMTEPTTKDINNIFKSLQPKKSTGFDEISSKLVKDLKFELITPIKIILTKMIREKTFPDIWKIAKVIPLFKKGDKQEVGNYRPISLLPALSKIAEKFIAKQIYDYLETKNLFPQTQFGFRRGKSTAQAITNLVYELEHRNKKQEKYALIMIDFSKAFDLIDHKILTDKLRKLGFQENAILLIKLYLSHRKQFVYCNDKKSSTITLSSTGAPQGSVIGPLLYLIYTIDIKELLKTHFHIMFADDTGLIIRLTKSQNTDYICDTLKMLLKHFTLNKLKMNIGKTVLLGKGIEGNIEISGKNMEIKNNSDREKYLGVKINPQLKWTAHFTDVCKKMKFGLHALAKIKK